MTIGCMEAVNTDLVDLPNLDQGIIEAAGDTNLGNALRRVQSIIEEDTEQKITNRAKPTRVDKLLRVALWEEFSRTQRDGDSMIARRVWLGICSEQYFLRLLKKDDKVAFLACPIHNYDLTNKLLLHTGQQKLIEIMEADIKDKNGKLDIKAASVVIKAYKMIEDRVKGGAVQRVQTQSQSLPAPQSLEEINAEIARLESNTIETQAVTVDAGE